MMKRYLLWLCVLFFYSSAFAHPMPSSIINLSVLDHSIRGEAKIPLLELANAVGDQRATNIHAPFFTTYFTDHIAAITDGKKWTTHIDQLSVITDQDPLIGNYQEVLVRFTLTPPDARYLRTFTFNYDAVVHQVVTHSALVFIRQDWDNGIQDENRIQQIGVIRLDIPTEKIFPLQVNLEEGSWLKGFRNMLSLGMQHIKEGTDHLLFLLVLLLPAMLVVNGRQWGRFGGLRYSLLRLLKIVTAFTIGHSITLLAGALGWVQLPGQPVEVLIAVSILISAVHAMRPIFPDKETFIAAGFGLVHGLAFATVLSKLELSAGKLALSILGFNAGIEIMQLFVIALIIPWLILLSRTPAYKWVRIPGAVFAGIAALAWIMEKSTGKANYITSLVVAATKYAAWGILALAVTSLIVYLTIVSTGRKAKLVS